jgi:hypothetical protein
MIFVLILLIILKYSIFSLPQEWTESRALLANRAAAREAAAAVAVAAMKALLLDRPIVGNGKSLQLKIFLNFINHIAIFSAPLVHQDFPATKANVGREARKALPVSRAPRDAMDSQVKANIQLIIIDH